MSRPVIYFECSNTYYSAVQTGIQRVVRNVARNLGPLAAARGYDAVPVVYVRGELRVADLGQVLQDKLATPMAVPAVSVDRSIDRPRRRVRSPREVAVAMLRPVYRGVRRGLSVLLPFPAAQRFLYAHPVQFGLAWCLLQPWRLVKRLMRRGRPAPPLAMAADPVALDDGFGASLDAVSDHAGDVLILLDASWSIPLWDAVERFQAAGGVTHGVIYDLVPITHADTSVRSLRAEYENWVRAHLRLSGRFVTISRTVGGQLSDYLARQDSSPFRVRSFYLGSELDFSAPGEVPRPAVGAVFQGAAHVFIAVGSIEPRKNHGFLLDAFEVLWARGLAVRLVIIGRFGWKNEAVVARIMAHGELGRRLFLMRDVTDSELDFAYGEASALVIASESEGFGLPVVEAFQRGLQVICSDIAVFREIAGAHALFFDLSSPDYLADVVEGFCGSHDVSARRERHPVPWLTWQESTSEFLDAVLS